MVHNLITDTWTTQITDDCKLIYPLKDVMIRKVKVLKRPKIDAVKLKEMYQHDKKGVESGKGRTAGDEDESAQNELTKQKKPKKKD